jgi:hypothetical protein
MAPEPPATETDCNKNCRPVLSSGRASIFRIKKFAVQDKKEKGKI